MASGPITSWQIDGETVETVADLIFWGSKITADVDFSHEIKRHLFLGRKFVTNLYSILKGRDTTLPTKVYLVKTMVYSNSHVWKWELDYKESWVLKNWCFWTVVLEKTFGSPLDFKEIQLVHPKGNLSWIFIGRIELEGSWNSNTVSTWWKELNHLKRPWCWERLKVGGEADDRGWDGCIKSPTQWTWVCVNSGSLVTDREAWCAVVHGVTKSQTWLSDRTELNPVTDTWIITSNVNGQKVPIKRDYQSGLKHKIELYTFCRKCTLKIKTYINLKG